MSSELELNAEIIRNLYFLWNSNEAQGWRKISEELVDYDEGSVTTAYVVQNIESGRFYSYTEMTNSWDDSDYDYDDDYEIEEVVPVEVTVIQYKTKK